MTGVQIANENSAVINLKVADLLFSWKDDATKKQKDAFQNALAKATKAGLQMALKLDRLSGFSLPIVMDLDVISLLSDISFQGGHRNLQIF